MSTEYLIARLFLRYQNDWPNSILFDVPQWNSLMETANEAKQLLCTSMNISKIIKREWEENSDKATSPTVVLILKESLQCVFERQAWEWNSEIY